MSLTVWTTRNPPRKSRGLAALAPLRFRELLREMIDRERDVARHHFRAIPTSENHERRFTPTIHAKPTRPMMSPIMDSKEIDLRRELESLLVTARARESVVANLLP